MIAAHLRGITKIKTFWVVITNFIPILEQCHLVMLIVVYAFMRHCYFQICSHMHPTSFDAGLNHFSKRVPWRYPIRMPYEWLTAVLSYDTNLRHPEELPPGYGVWSKHWKTKALKAKTQKTETPKTKTPNGQNTEIPKHRKIVQLFRYL